MDFNEIITQITSFFADNPSIWIYLIIPFTAAIIGWGTNVLALKMTVMSTRIERGLFSNNS